MIESRNLRTRNELSNVLTNNAPTVTTTYSPAAYDLVCFSHLRWDFVYQRPQHLLTRFARERRVFFIEEPIYDNGSVRLDVSVRDSGVHVVVPHLPEGLRSQIATEAVLRDMLERLFVEHNIDQFAAWYYTPFALGFTKQLLSNGRKPVATIYDCMDELSLFKGASPVLREREAELFGRADLVFTGGQSLYEAKRVANPDHESIHAFPSSIDRAHFAQARQSLTEPEDQKGIAYPRFGFFGVIDERFDIELLDQIAAARPAWQFVMIGPVVKIDPETLPKHANIHYLGSKKYKQLPAYLAGWDAALLLFARNEATRFISPTKTPEYLAAGKPVVSTSIRDVVRPYGDEKLVQIADEPQDFINALERVLAQSDAERAAWLGRVDKFLGHMSWDETWSRMRNLIDEVAHTRVVTTNRPTQKPLAQKARAASAASA